MHSKKLFDFAQLKFASFGSAGSVHGYARVHTSIYIYICVYTSSVSRRVFPDWDLRLAEDARDHIQQGKCGEDHVAQEDEKHDASRGYTRVCVL